MKTYNITVVAEVKDDEEALLLMDRIQIEVRHRFGLVTPDKYIVKCLQTDELVNSEAKG